MYKEVKIKEIVHKLVKAGGVGLEQAVYDIVAAHTASKPSDDNVQDLAFMLRACVDSNGANIEELLNPIYTYLETKLQTIELDSLEANPYDIDFAITTKSKPIIIPSSKELPDSRAVAKTIQQNLISPKGTLETEIDSLLSGRDLGQSPHYDFLENYTSRWVQYSSPYEPKDIMDIADVRDNSDRCIDERARYLQYFYNPEHNKPDYFQPYDKYKISKESCRFTQSFAISLMENVCEKVLIDRYKDQARRIKRENTKTMIIDLLRDYESKYPLAGVHVGLRNRGRSIRHITSVNIVETFNEIYHNLLMYSYQSGSRRDNRITWIIHPKMWRDLLMSCEPAVPRWSMIQHDYNTNNPLLFGKHVVESLLIEENEVFALVDFVKPSIIVNRRSKYFEDECSKDVMMYQCLYKDTILIDYDRLKCGRFIIERENGFSR